ncbi:hypothetical protein ACJX0J_014654 [Zea mays]
MCRDGKSLNYSPHFLRFIIYVRRPYSYVSSELWFGSNIYSISFISTRTERRVLLPRHNSTVCYENFITKIDMYSVMEVYRTDYTSKFPIDILSTNYLFSF